MKYLHLALFVLAGGVVAIPSLSGAVAVAFFASVLIADRFADALASEATIKKIGAATVDAAAEVKEMRADIKKHHEDIISVVDRHGMRR